jgi:hypothetical protein
LDRKCIGENIINDEMIARTGRYVTGDNNIAVICGKCDLYLVTPDKCHKIISGRNDFRHGFVRGDLILARMNDGFEIYTIKGVHICTIWGYHHKKFNWDSFDNGFLTTIKMTKNGNIRNIGHVIDTYIY